MTPSGRFLAVILALLGALVASAAMLGSWDPSHARFYPRCLFHAATGWHCPGCGTLRAGYFLLHGQPLTALRHNPIWLILLPFLAYLLGVELHRLLVPKRSRLRVPPWTVYMVLCLFAAFCVLRNLPWYPFTLLAPPS